MTRPPFRPILGVAAGLIVGVGGAMAAAETAPAAPTEPAKPKPAWVERLASESKKLAFWDKEKKQAEPPAPPPAPPTAATKKQKLPARPAAAPDDPAKPAAAPPSRRRPASSQKPEPAPQPTPAERPAEKKSLFSKLPSLPFVKKRGEPEPEAALPTSEPPESKKKPAVPLKPAAASKRGESTPPDSAAPTETQSSEEKRPGLFDLGRFLPGGKKGETMAAPEVPNTLADRKSKAHSEAALAESGARKPGGAKPGAKPDAGADAGALADAKPSFWDRMTAAITPKSNSEAKPATTPVPKGLPPMAPGVVDAATFVITKDDSPFYTFGPQQATPPDAYLPTGTVVTLTQKNWGWATVRLGDGRSGVVDRSALRPALLADLMPAGRPGDALMASLTPGQAARKSSPNFVLPAAEMPDLPTGGGATGVAGNPLLLPFSPDDVTDPGQLPPLPDIPPLPEPAAEAPDNAAPEPAGTEEPAGPVTPEAPAQAEGSAEPAQPAQPAPEPTSPEEGPAVEPAPKPEAGE